MGYFAGHATLGDVAHYWELEEASGTRVAQVNPAFQFSDFNTVTREAGLGPGGYAARFTRANSEILYIDNIVFNTDFSISCWVYPINDPGANYVGIHGFGTGWPTATQLSVYRGNTSPGQVLTLISDTAGGYQYTYNTGSSYNLNYNAWNWLAVTYTAADRQIRTRINGTATQTSAALATNRYNTAQQWDIGYTHIGGATSQFFDGRIAEYGYWARGLTKDELDALWNSGNGLFLRSPETFTKTGSTACASTINGPKISSNLYSGTTAAQSVVNGAKIFSMYKVGSTSAKARFGGSGTINWTNISGVTVDSTGLTKTAGVGWTNAGTFSLDYINSDETGWFEYTLPASPGYAMFGLSSVDTNYNYDTINYAMYYYPPTACVLFYENGSYKGQTAPIPAESKIRIAAEAGVVKGYVNGALVWTSVTAPTFPLYCDTAFYDTGAKMLLPTMYNGKAYSWQSSLVKAGSVPAQSTVNGPRVGSISLPGLIVCQSTLDSIREASINIFGSIACQSTVDGPMKHWFNPEYVTRITNRLPQFETNMNRRAVYPRGYIRGWRDRH